MGLIEDIQNQKEIVKCRIDGHPCSGYYTGVCSMVGNIEEINSKAKKEKIIPKNGICIFVVITRYNFISDIDLEKFRKMIGK